MEREALELQQCTFKPQTTPLPAYLVRRIQEEQAQRLAEEQQQEQLWWEEQQGLDVQQDEVDGPYTYGSEGGEGVAQQQQQQQQQQGYGEGYYGQVYGGGGLGGGAAGATASTTGRYQVGGKLGLGFACDPGVRILHHNCRAYRYWHVVGPVLPGWMC